MTPRLVRSIMRRHPRLYRLAQYGPRQSCMCFGFECGDGWAGILSWVTLCFRAAWCLLRYDARAMQVKEKYGGMRFYWSGTSPRWLGRWLGLQATRVLWWVEGRAEELSYQTCEKCGARGRCEPTRGWWATLCDKCRREKR